MSRIDNLKKPDGTFYTKKVKWTEDALKLEAVKYKSRGEFKKNNAAAYKAARQQGIIAVLFPETLRLVWTIEMARDAAEGCTSRAQFQKKSPYGYIAAKKYGILHEMFPVQQNKKRWDLESLKLEALKYKSRDELYTHSPGAHSVACKLKVLNDLGLPLAGGVSNAELELLAYAKSLSSDFESKRFKNDYQLDAYSESLKIGIEYNGHYFHSESTGKSSTYHLKKTKYFEALGIRVIHIWEYEWRDRQEQVKDFIRSACGKNTVRIGARKCEFKKALASAEARAFLNDTHIQGAPSQTKYAVGCFYNGNLVGVCSFGMHHRGGEGVVLNRFACAPNYTISGFLAKASKLALLYFKQPISSWAHIAKSQGRGYLAAGWTVDKILPPDYFYSDTQGKYISKQSRKKSAVGTPNDMTESEHAKNDGLYKIWDCGKIRLVFKQAA